MISRLAVLAVVGICALTTVPVSAADKVLQIPMRVGGPNSLDPIRGSSVYDNRACAQVYETLLQHKYLVRPPELEPLLLSKMPDISEDGRTWTFELKEGVRFHDDACFPGGKGRVVQTDDVFYSLRRLADPEYSYKNWWVLANSGIKGFTQYKESQAKTGKPFDYDAPIAGFRKIDDRRFEIHLEQRVVSFAWSLSMFQLSIVPREAVEHYGDKFNRHPVGTGPFLLKDESDWVSGSKLTFHKNPTYHPCTYPAEHTAEDKENGFDAPAGTPLPIVDRIEFTMFVQDQPMWLKFQAGEIGYTQVPAESFTDAYSKRSKRLKKSMRNKGIVSHALPLLDFIFRGFNMTDETFGGYTEKKIALRKAISLAIDLEEFNDSFYNSINTIYDGPIPPGLGGHPADGVSSVASRGPDLDQARALLAKAGYPDGKGLAPIEYYTNTGGNSKEQSELLRRQLGKIGVEVKVHQAEFAVLMDYIDNSKAQMFGFAWGSDYPDAENNLALFYGPNKSPGSNHFNYQRDEYDRMYEKILSMPSGPARTAIMAKMRDMVLQDVPYIGSMARIRFYLVNPWMKNFKPSELFYNWLKYVDVDDSKRPGA